MKRILVPVSFSETSKNALVHAFSIAKEFSAKLSLLYCSPTYEYAREYDFGEEDYETGIREKLSEFYEDCIENGKDYLYSRIACFGSVSDFSHRKGPEFDLLVMSRKIGFESRSNSWFGDKLHTISLEALCPVLITSTQPHGFSFQKAVSIWHFQRNLSENELVRDRVLSLGIDPKLVVTKSLQQDSFISLFWQNVVAYSKSHNEGLLKEISSSFDREKIDLLIIVNNRKGMFEKFLKDDVFQIISQFDIPILILQTQEQAIQ